MKKRIALATVCLAAAVGVVVNARPGEAGRYAGEAAGVARKAWDGVAANPVPVAFALGTFLLTVVYHKAKGKSLRESVEAAATRVTVVAVPAPAPPAPAGAGEPAVVARAKARATRAQLLADQILLQNRHRKLPEAVLAAEKDVCHTQHALTDAGRALGERKKAHAAAVAALQALRKEKAAGEAEQAEIEAELKKLAEVV